MKGTTPFNNLQLYIGIDVYKKQWSVRVFMDVARHRTFIQPPSPSALKTYVEHPQNVATGSVAHSSSSDISTDMCPPLIC
jgi:hypothetical protein